MRPPAGPRSHRDGRHGPAAAGAGRRRGTEAMEAIEMPTFRTPRAGRPALLLALAVIAVLVAACCGVRQLAILSTVGRRVAGQHTDVVRGRSPSRGECRGECRASRGSADGGDRRRRCRRRRRRRPHRPDRHDAARGQGRPAGRRGRAHAHPRHGWLRRRVRTRRTTATSRSRASRTASRSTAGRTPWPRSATSTARRPRSSSSRPRPSR